MTSFTAVMRCQVASACPSSGHEGQRSWRRGSQSPLPGAAARTKAEPSGDATSRERPLCFPFTSTVPPTGALAQVMLLSLRPGMRAVKLRSLLSSIFFMAFSCGMERYSWMRANEMNWDRTPLAMVRLFSIIASKSKRFVMQRPNVPAPVVLTFIKPTIQVVVAKKLQRKEILFPSQRFKVRVETIPAFIWLSIASQISRVTRS
mmetsp:Transcript_121177/g.258680  ORF Transcript_121177/g.258680 Transcript_121177/m.258680 type:complete len:204 (-) Transcript_121177:1238-1849(-)